MDTKDSKTFFFYNETTDEKIILGSDMLFGRKKKADYVLSDSQTSGSHFFISIKTRSIYIEDLDSTNQTFLNGKAIKPRSLYQLEHGDVIRVGNTKYTFIHGNTENFNIPDAKLCDSHNELSIVLDKAIPENEFGTKSVQNIIRFEKNEDINKNEISIPVIKTSPQIREEEYDRANERINNIKKIILQLTSELDELENDLSTNTKYKKIS